MSFKELPTSPEETPSEIQYIHDPKFKELAELAQSLEMSICHHVNLTSGLTEASIFYFYPETGKTEHLADAVDKDPIEATRLAIGKAIEGLEPSEKPTVH